MSNEHQPGSPVDLTILDRAYESGDLHFVADSYRRMAAELRTLRARVGELEQEDDATLAATVRMDARITDLESQLAAAQTENAKLLDENVSQQLAACELIALFDADGGHAQEKETLAESCKRAERYVRELAAAREEQALVKSVEAMLVKRNADRSRYELIELRIGCAFGEINWQGDGNDGVFATLPALLRAILEVEKGGAGEG